jgi:transketolase
VGHIGGALSIVEALAVLYWKELKADPAAPRAADRDRLVLSKGHAGPALYSALALRGFFPEEWLHTLNKGGTNLPSHCDRNRTPGIDMTTGSLGQGISAACGIALANRIDGRKVFTFAIIGDGESDEGQVWEAAMFAAHNRLDHLVAFTDNNRMQIDGSTAEIMNLDAAGSDFVAKWKAFGWESERVDGHDVAAIDAAVVRAKARAEAALAGSPGKPTMIVLDTVKGKGAAFCEGQVGSHNMNFDYETAKKAIAALG